MLQLDLFQDAHHVSNDTLFSGGTIGWKIIGAAHECSYSCAVCNPCIDCASVDSLVLCARDTLLDRTYYSSGEFATAMSRYMQQREVWLAAEQLQALERAYPQLLTDVRQAYVVGFEGVGIDEAEVALDAGLSPDGFASSSTQFAPTPDTLYVHVLYPFPPQSQHEWFIARAGRAFLLSPHRHRRFSFGRMRQHPHFWNVLLESPEGAE